MVILPLQVAVRLDRLPRVSMLGYWKMQTSQMDIPSYKEYTVIVPGFHLAVHEVSRWRNESMLSACRCVNVVKSADYR